MKYQKLPSSLEQYPPLKGSLKYHKHFEGKNPIYGDFPKELHPKLLEGLIVYGPKRPYIHQEIALNNLLSGRDVILSTPTASGKSLPFYLAAFDSILKNCESKALFIYPYKALSQDQKRKMEDMISVFGLNEISIGIYDGDTTAAERRKIMQKPPSIILSNPDMLHLGLIPHHGSFSGFLKNLKWIFIDEAHTYKGIFGAHMHNLLIRLNRIISYYGAETTIGAASATLQDPHEFSKLLFQKKLISVSDTGSPSSGSDFFLLSTEESPYSLATKLLEGLIERGFKTIVFTKARRITELIYSWLVQSNPAFKKHVSSYRAGFLPSERRQIERELSDGSLKGIVSTSALELGIDIGGLDACILVGYPGSLMSTFQRMGRVGRKDKPGLIFLIALPDALDQYFVNNPDVLFGRAIESIVCDPSNEKIVSGHLLCSCSEKPMKVEETDIFPKGRAYASRLEKDGDLLCDGAGEYYYCRIKRPERFMSLRGIGESYRILKGKELIGTIDGVRVFSECHEQSIYLHRGQTFLVRELDIKARKVILEETDADFYTQALSDKETNILSVDEETALGHLVLKKGKLKVIEHFRSFLRKHIINQTVLSEDPIDLPPVSFETEGFWITIRGEYQKEIGDKGLDVMGALHGTEHAMIGIFPLIAIADRWDIGGISTCNHPQVGEGAIFIYDGYPGGIGLCAKAFESFEKLLSHTKKVIDGCPCEDGCPACIHSPKCGSGNRPLDKEGSKLLLEILSNPEWIPSSPAKSLPVIKKEISLPEKSGRQIVFDLETKKSAEEVNGWENADKMGVSLAVIYNIDEGKYKTFFEEEVNELIETLKRADKIIGFNIIGFDMKVLRGYTKERLESLPILDILEEVRSVIGFRLSLSSLARANFNTGKEADGLQAIEWYRQKRFDLLESYCRKDVELTYLLYKKGITDGYILFHDKNGNLMRLHARWK